MPIVENMGVHLVPLAETIEQLQGNLQWQRTALQYGQRPNRVHGDAGYRRRKTELALVLNHAATLVGYFDGFNARGVFQKRTAQAVHEFKVCSDESLLGFAIWALDELLTVIERIRARDSLSYCTNGPRKPGLEATVRHCVAHLDALREWTIA